jgi:hypothetical protein
VTSGIQFAFCPNSRIAPNVALWQKQFYFIADARLLFARVVFLVGFDGH